MYESGLVPRRMTYKDDEECLNYGIGFTNIVPRTTRSSNDLSRYDRERKIEYNHYIFVKLVLCVYRKEMRDWSVIMINRMKELNPLIVCFNGKGIKR